MIILTETDADIIANYFREEVGIIEKGYEELLDEMNSKVEKAKLFLQLAKVCNKDESREEDMDSSLEDLEFKINEGIRAASEAKQKKVDRIHHMIELLYSGSEIKLDENESV